MKCALNIGFSQQSKIILGVRVRLLNRGVRRIQVRFKVNMGKKFRDLNLCLLNKKYPLNTGFTVECYVQKFKDMTLEVMQPNIKNNLLL